MNIRPNLAWFLKTIINVNNSEKFHIALEYLDYKLSFYFSFFFFKQKTLNFYLTNILVFF